VAWFGPSRGADTSNSLGARDCAGRAMATGKVCSRRLACASTSHFEARFAQRLVAATSMTDDPVLRGRSGFRSRKVF